MEQTTNIDKETLRIYWHVTLRNRKFFVLSLLFLFSKVLISVLLPYLVSVIFARMVTGADVEPYIIWLGVVVIIGTATNQVGITNILALNAKGQYDLLETSLQALLKRSVGFHTNTIGGKLVNNALEYPQAYGRFIDAIYANLLPFFLVLFFGIGVVAIQSLALAGVLLVVTAVTIILAVTESRKRIPIRNQRRRVQNNMIANLSDTIVNAQAVKTFAHESEELAAHQKLSRTLLDYRFRDWSSASRSGSVRMGILLALQVLLIAFIAHLYTQDPSILGVGIFAFAYTITLTNRLFEITSLLRTLEESFLDASSMTKVLLEDIEIQDKPHASDLVIEKGAIAIQDITFSYQDDDSNENVFTHLSLDIPAGQKVGVVGPSGGGKSTLTRLLLRFEDVTSGSITIDGQDIRDVKQTSLRQSIAYVPQEPLLFHRSIKENIAYGLPNASLKEIQRAAKLAFADEFIDQLPKGYDTIVGERGVKLSGGQRQRVAIARAILKDAPILILDEATSALDSESEVYIQKALEQLMKGRTTIVIAHRLSTIQKLDRVIVLDKGRVQEDGTHTKLLTNKKLYAKLWSHQSGGFIEE